MSDIIQYVGARYVPLFADPIEWNSSATYEPLTIVTYMNASYTSRKQVPAGIEPTNNEYWALTGNYNAQVEEYRQEVESLKTSFNNNIFVNVLDYGAIGDGIADDGPAFQQAVNSGKPVFVPTNNNQSYRINTTVNCPAGTKMFGESPTFQYVPITASGIGIYVTAAVGFNCEEQSSFENLNLYQDQANKGNIYFQTPTGSNSNNIGGSECNFVNCQFYNGLTGILSRARGDVVNGCQFHAVGAPFEIQYTNDGTGGNVYQQPTTGARGYLFINNKCHSTYRGVHITTGNINNLLISNNSFDIIYTAIDIETNANLLNSIISNNTSHYTKNSFIWQKQNSTCTNVNIENNIVSANLNEGEGVQSGTPNYLINLGTQNEHSFVNICGNTLIGANTSTISTSNISNSNISNNIINANSTSSNAIQIAGSCNYLSICNNIAIRQGGNNFAQLLHGFNTPVLGGSNIIGNSGLFTAVSDISATGTKPNNIQEQ